MARAARKTGMALVWHIAGLAWAHPGAARLRGGVAAAFGVVLAVACATFDASDPSFNASTGLVATNALGAPGAVLADLGVQSLGLAAVHRGADLSVSTCFIPILPAKAGTQVFLT